MANNPDDCLSQSHEGHELRGLRDKQWLLCERRHDRRVVARTDLGLHRAARGPHRTRLAGQDVVEPPADVALPHVAPGRPPAEESIVAGIEGAPKIHESAAEDAFD